MPAQRPDPVPVLVIALMLILLIVFGFGIDRRERELKQTQQSLNSCMVNLTHCLSSGSLLDKVSGRAYLCDVAKVDGL